MTTAKIELPPKLIQVFQGDARYRGAHGGRGGAKTRAFGLMTAVHGYRCGKAGIEGQILCGREFQNSLEESSMDEVKAAIRSVDWLDDYYEIGERFIRSKDRMVNYTFTGLRHNLDSIKSKARVLLAWADEAESISEAAWRKLTPTVREDGSEIWVTWNPESSESATHKRFRASPPDGAKIAEINWSDNPWFPDALNAERLEDQKKRPDTYDHVWEGGFLTISDAQVFKGKFVVDEFEPKPHWDGPYYGMDFGFAQDPTCAGDAYVSDNVLYLRREAGKVGLELDHTAQFFKDRLPGVQEHTIRADSARPESISYLSRHGLPNIQGVKKWQGSVADGVSFIKSFDKVVIHPDCPETAREFRLYSYKIDRLSGDILPVIIDANNHHIDRIRYALGPLIQNNGYDFFAMAN